MDIYLLKEERFPVGAATPRCFPLPRPLEFTVNLSLPDWIQPGDELNEFEKRQFDAFKNFLKERCSGATSELLIKITPPDIPIPRVPKPKFDFMNGFVLLNTARPLRRDVLVASPAFEELKDALYAYSTVSDNEETELDLSLILTFNHYDVHRHEYIKSIALKADKLENIQPALYKLSELEWKLPPCYLPAVQRFPDNDAKNVSRTPPYWSATLKFKVDSFQWLGDHTPVNANSAYLLNNKDCDFALELEDGCIIPCHKKPLADCSPVFAAMFAEPKYLESSEGKFKIHYISREGANALLKFCYFNGVNDAVASCKIAFELLQAADLFDIATLWQEMLTVLMVKPFEWFDIELTLTKIEFVMLKEQELSKRLLKILGANYDEVIRSPLYNQVFKTEMEKKLFELVIEPVRKQEVKSDEVM